MADVEDITMDENQHADNVPLDTLSWRKIKSMVEKAGGEYTSKEDGIAYLKGIDDSASDIFGTSSTPVAPIKNMTTAQDKKTVVINIPKTEREHRPVAVGLNGTMYTVPRGVDVRVPVGVVNVLRDAVETRVDPETMERRPVPSYPFNIVG